MLPFMSPSLPKIDLKMSSSKCKLCLSNTSLFADEEDLQISLKAIKEMFKIKMETESETVPICQICSEELNQFYCFYQRIRTGLNMLEPIASVEICDIKLEPASPILCSSEVKIEIDENLEIIKTEEIITADLLKPILDIVDEKMEESQVLDFQDNNLSEVDLEPANSSQETDQQDSDFKVKLPNPLPDIEIRIARLRGNLKLTQYERRRAFFEFTCCKCYQKFDEEADLKKHFKKVHYSKLMYFCCGKKITTAIIDDHLRFHADPTSFRCPACGHQAKSKSSNRYHQIRCKQMATCSVCGVQIKPFKFSTHMKTQHKPVKVKVVGRQPNLNAIAGPSSNLYTCDHCKKHYETYERLKKHIKSIHLSARERYVCELCGSNQSGKAALMLHMKSAHGDLEQCQVCHRRVKYARTHFLYYHDKSNPCMCTKCGTSFDNARQLDRHNRRKHYELQDQFVCKECGKCFKRQFQLKEHEHIHLGTYKYSCELCTFQVNYKRNLRAHIKKIHPDYHKQKCAERLKEMYGPSMMPKTLEGNVSNLSKMKIVGTLPKL